MCSSWHRQGPLREDLGMTGGLLGSGEPSGAACRDGCTPRGRGSAQAADLGGDCCADLEERIAELEATTARKGNRKVSLTISGWVNEAVFFWDDGVESNAYVGTNELEQTASASSAKPRSTTTGPPATRSKSASTAPAPRRSARTSRDRQQRLDRARASWYLKSKTLGKVTVGQEGTATYHLLDNADFAPTPATTRMPRPPRVYTRRLPDARRTASCIAATWWSTSWAASTTTRPARTAGATSSATTTPDIRRLHRHGLLGRGRHVGHGSDLQERDRRLQAGRQGRLRREHRSDHRQRTGATAARTGNLDCQWWGAAGTIMHDPTGLFVYGAYGSRTRRSRRRWQDDDSDTWFIQAGIERSGSRSARRRSSVNTARTRRRLQLRHRPTTVVTKAAADVQNSGSRHLVSRCRSEHRAQPRWTST